MKRINGEKGFTLIELLIASTVFSVIMLLCTFALISVGRSYYKGVTIARTQEVARNLMDDITQAIQFSGGTVVPAIPNNPADSTDDNVTGFCVDNRRYSIIPNDLLNDTATDHAVVVDDPGAPCGSIFVQNIAGGGSLSTSSKEFLLPNMRIAAASIQPVSGRLYRVHIKVISGDDAALENIGTPNVRCSNAISNSQFCTVAELTSIVQKRLE